MDEIVVGVDGSEGAARALRWAAEEAAVRGGRVRALMAWGSLDPGLAGFSDALDDTGAREAADDAVTAAGLTLDEVSVEVPCLPPASALADAAKDAAMLVVGSRGLGGFKGLLLGSVSDQCLRLSTSPVVVVPPADADRPDAATGRIVVGTDGSAASRRAIDWALDEARRRGAHVQLVHAWQPPFIGWQPVEQAKGAAEKRLEDVTASLPEDAEVVVEPALVCANPADALVQAGRDADLLVVAGRPGKTMAPLVLGSVARPVVHHAPCPVVIVPGG